MKKTTVFNVLVWLVIADIVLTIVAVGVFGATELNPLCNDFQTFVAVKIIVSIIGMFIISNMRDLSIWVVAVGILAGLYGMALIFNLANILVWSLN